MTLIGVDCATNARNVGIARALWRDGVCELAEVGVAPTWDDITATVAAGCAPPTLVAIDAPLGWPAPLGRALANHTAGSGIEGTANGLFRRATDDLVAARVGKRPLDVGADRIARTAHQALAFLDALRAATGHDVPLAFEPSAAAGLSALEVYPAATLAVRAIRSSGYKGKKGEAPRDEILAALRDQDALRFDDVQEAAMRDSDHVLDAALCCLAAADFMQGDVLRPDDLQLARREGWIWVKRPE